MRRGIFGGLGLVIIVAIGIALYLSVFIVDQTQQALVLRFGEAVRKIDAPGLYYKLPLVDTVVDLDKRVLDLESPPLEIIASDQKRLVVDAFGRYRIADPLLFFQAVGSIQGAESRLSVVLQASVRRVLGDAEFIDVVRNRRSVLMAQIKDQVEREAQTFGVKVVDVKIRHADLPPSNSQAIIQRMQTERQRQATEIRATGEQASRRIKAEADRDVIVIKAKATGESERVRGEGEAEKNRILAEAFGKDPDFFAFYRSMQAYETGLKGSATRLVISPDSEFFRFFNNPDAASGPVSLGARPRAASEPAPAVKSAPAAATPAVPSGTDSPTKPPEPPAAVPPAGAPAPAQ